MKPVTVITGASSGIGMELARVFAAHGHELALVARRERELTTLADALAFGGRPQPLVLHSISASGMPAPVLPPGFPRAISSRGTWSTMPASGLPAPLPPSTARNSSP